ncbi:dihydrodipicolinate synthase [Ophiostoma piceae UAMH 11346]|uniref:Dihydrodipicolinate synthase n=1 Tax=Ophiostoma piceae (strain UAMH 11346) TaxID=1262450 RepID=S3BMV7_OPHP1|nr:dihydrodipicolinate synthase [Ophiostoma piceae UAMH 11346]
MAPHNNASPSGSYTAGFNRFGPRSTTAAAFAAATTTEASSPLSSSFDSASADAVVADGHEQDFHTGSTRLLVPGVYVPTMCFFDPETEDIDTATIARHAVRLARSGVTGLATQGSNGEAVHLTHAERRIVTQTTRVALNNAGFDRMPIIVGCGSQSTRETIQLCTEAWAAGGDFALVLPPSYYAPLFKPSAQTVLEYFRAVADASPIPLLIYNYPGAVNGMDLSSDIVVQLAAHPNIVGVKLTCGNTGKLNRVASATRKLYPGKPGEPAFLVLGGSADFTVQTLAAGGHGILAGLANIAPKACIKTVELFAAGNLGAAQAMQETLSQGDWTAIQGGVVGVKAGMEAWSGYGGFARSPLPKPTVDEAAKWKEGFRELVLLEKSL